MAVPWSRAKPGYRAGATEPGLHPGKAGAKPLLGEMQVADLVAGLRGTKPSSISKARGCRPNLGSLVKLVTVTHCKGSQIIPGFVSLFQAGCNGAFLSL